jgi:hypothetical protein
VPRGKVRIVINKKDRGEHDMTQVRQPSLEKFTQRDEDGTMYTVSLQIVLYANKPLAEIAEGATACYRLFLDRFGDSLNWYLARSMRKARRFSEKYIEIFPTLCRESGTGLPLYRVFNGSGLQDYLPPVFATGAYGAFSWLQVHLPPSLANDWKELLTLLTTMARPFPFRCGIVGLSLCWNDMSVDRDIQVPKLIGALLKRYPGFNLGTPRELCDQDLPPVNWLTLIGPELLGKLGGVDAVRQALADDAISVIPLGPGACIRAGEAPQLGDLNRGDNLPVYRKVGAYLKEYRGHQEIELDGLNEEESEAWLARFDS